MHFETNRFAEVSALHFGIDIAALHTDFTHAGVLFTGRVLPDHIKRYSYGNLFLVQHWLPFFQSSKDRTLQNRLAVAKSFRLNRALKVEAFLPTPSLVQFRRRRMN